jgi:hypothetical protein
MTELQSPSKLPHNNKTIDQTEEIMTPPFKIYRSAKTKEADLNLPKPTKKILKTHH